MQEFAEGGIVKDVVSMQGQRLLAMPGMSHDNNYVQYQYYQVPLYIAKLYIDTKAKGSAGFRIPKTPNIKSQRQSLMRIL